MEKIKKEYENNNNPVISSFLKNTKIILILKK